MHKLWCLILVLLASLPAAAYKGDDAVYPPPATGPFAYNAGFVPIVGASYVDPVFGETVRRLTGDGIADDIYARNMWWNADGTRYLHRTQVGGLDRWQVIDVSTSQITHDDIPFGTFAADGGFDPVDPNALYSLVEDRGDGRGEIRKITLNLNGTWNSTVFFTAPAQKTLKSLGGTLNWWDASGRYLLVRYGTEPSVYLYDRADLATPYANPINMANYNYLGLSPDGSFVVGYQDVPQQGVSWAITHTPPALRQIAAAPNVFWTLCGDHGSFLSASDGRNYMIVKNCNERSELWRVDISNNAAGLNEDQQRALPNNRLLLSTTWDEAVHVSTMATGDWAFVATEDDAAFVDPLDAFDTGTNDGTGYITPWHVYRQEIIAINVIANPLDVRRLAHHRSRFFTSATCTDCNYPNYPRLSASWRGTVVGFASNFNRDQPGGGPPALVDIFVIPFASSTGPQDVTWTNVVNAVASGNSLLENCDGCGNSGAQSSQTIGSGDGYVEFSATETTTMRAAGLGNGNTDNLLDDIDFAIVLRESGWAEVFEDGAFRWDTPYAANDRFRVSVESGVVRYYKNGTPFYTSTVSPTYPFLVDTALYSPSSTIVNAVISGSQ